jgi:hypothetical protein
MAAPYNLFDKNVNPGHRVLNEGGLVWKGRRSYTTLNAALTDAEEGVARWIRDELGITYDA